MTSQDGQQWQSAWQPLMDAVGEDLSDGRTTWGADAVELGSVRRWLEPLEFDCALHYDETAARRAGWDGVIAPYTSVLTFAIPATWAPGRTVFTEEGRDAQPAFSPITTPSLPLAPPTSGFFATDLEIDFVRPLALGDRVGRRGFRLIGCVPKQTSVGRGAFLTWETELVDGALEVVARQRTTAYAYNPLQQQQDP